jgi:hypothetical protein
MVAKRKYTIWHLEKHEFNETDAAWCNWFDIKVMVYPLFNIDEWVGDSIKLITENNIQIAMLKFKYEYRLIKIREKFLTPSEYEELGFK